MSPLKPWLAFADQLQLLQARGLEVNNRAAALDYLERLRSLNFIRNISANHSRLWNINVVERAPVPAHWSAQLDNARPFLYFCLMRQLLGVICPRSTWGQRVTDLLEKEFPNTGSARLTLQDFGALEGWANAPPWKQERKK